MFSSLADPAKTTMTPQALLTKEQEREHIQLLLSRVTVHQADHANRSFDGCMFCTVRALMAIESNAPTKDKALQFVSRQDRGFVLESIRQIRNGWGAEAPRWMFKEEYLC